MTHQPSRQKGMTLIGFLLMLTVAGFFVLLGLKLFPIYLEHFQIKSSLTSLKSDPEFASRSRDEILSALEKRWDINGITRVDARKDAVIEKSFRHVKVRVAYERVEPIVGNV
ncbi:MAG: DUF4845 domain-containing protein, partial [Methylococcaceae bacterium]|nr:DUF4845 domain-containing protein [Methylococcaceae bacterium]